MPYATPAELSTLIGDDEYLALTDRDGDGSEDAGVAAAAIAHAEGVVNGYLATSPTVSVIPLPTVPETVKARVMDIAIHRLAGNHVTDEQRFRYEDALKWLRDVAKGLATLGESPSAPDSSEDVMVSASKHHFSRRDQRGIL